MKQDLLNTERNIEEEAKRVFDWERSADHPVTIRWEDLPEDYLAGMLE